MDQTAVRIPANGVVLEGAYAKNPDTEHAVVICHPHPLYGGDMDNAVVMAAETAFLAKGFSVLRLNFRGCGKSTGSFCGTSGEREDLAAALSWLAKQHDCVSVCGYSFGAWVAALARPAVDRMVLIAPPVDFLAFPKDLHLPALTQVVAAGRDTFGRAEEIRHMVPQWNKSARFDLFSDTDHFFSGALSRLTTCLMDGI